MSTRLVAAVLTAAAGAGVAGAVRAVHTLGQLPGGSRRWERTNHSGDPVTLTEGVALGVGVGVPLLLIDPPAGWAVLLAGAAGAADDLGGRTDVKGLRGHLTALRSGEVTTGSVKIVALGAAGLGAALWSDRRSERGIAADTAAGAAIVAGAANLANLLDLRPGRALKVALALAAPIGTRPAAAAVLGAGAIVFPDDLRGRSMLGDTGANALGAAVGVAAAQALSARGRWALLAALSALTLISEKVSFTEVIDATPGLRELDRWGRT